MSSRGLLIENIVSLSVLQAVNYAVPLITLPYLARVLQPSQFGLLSFAQAIVLYFDFFTDFGFNFSQTRAIANCRSVPEAVSRIFWSTIYAKAVLMLISAMALSLLVALTPKLRETPELFAVNFLYVVGTAFFPMWLFQGLEKLKLAAALFGSARLLTIPALFLLVKQPHDYVVAGAIQASVEVTASITAWPVILTCFGLGWYRPSVRDIRETLQHAWPLFLSASAIQISASSAVVVLGFTAGKIEVGYFSAADKLIKASIAALNPLGQALYPHITAAKARSPFSALRLIRKSFFAVGLLSTSVSALIFFLARPVCHILLGKSFDHSSSVLQCLSPLPLLFGLAGVCGTQTMLVFDMDELFSKIVLSTAMLGLPVTVVLSTWFGAAGAAFAAVTTAALMLTGMAFALHARGVHIWRHPNSESAAVADSAFQEAAGI